MRRSYQNLRSRIGVYGPLLSLVTLLNSCGGVCPIGTVRVPDQRQPEGYRCEAAPRGLEQANE
jgi:hypothetical protein